MHLKSILILCCLAVVECMKGENHHNEEKTKTSERILDLPEDIMVVYEDASSYIQQQNDNIEHVKMGVPDDRCDNARFHLETDFDPKNVVELQQNTLCIQGETFEVDKSILPLLTIVQLPKRYVPIHRCMRIRIKYIERIPTIGPHRPLWARYGEYEYVPPQRWLHNVEHGAIVLLYHPCADPDEVNKLKTLIKKCLWRHVITPYPSLTKERPFALVGWAAHLEMSHFDYELAKNFTKFFAKSGPEHTFRDGQYNELLTQSAEIVTNVIDSQICPDL